MIQIQISYDHDLNLTTYKPFFRIITILYKKPLLNIFSSILSTFWKWNYLINTKIDCLGKKIIEQKDLAIWTE